jgi:hypothetical protein
MAQCYCAGGVQKLGVVFSPPQTKMHEAGRHFAPDQDPLASGLAVMSRVKIILGRSRLRRTSTLATGPEQ